MSGHNKWAQIKHKKAIVDAKKGKVFSKLARAISLAARGNPDPETNPRLKGEIERARAVNMPGENIERAIRKVSDKDAAALSEVQLDFIGPGGAAIIVRAVTDNSNRTIGELKQLAGKFDAHMASQGSASWMFKKSGVLRLARNDEDAALRAIDAGADDVQDEGGVAVVYTTPEHFARVKDALGSLVVSSSLELIPTTPCPVSDVRSQEKLEALLTAFDEHDDVQDVYTNADY